MIGFSFIFTADDVTSAVLEKCRGIDATTFECVLLTTSQFTTSSRTLQRMGITPNGDYSTFTVATAHNTVRAAPNVAASTFAECAAYTGKEK
jgi:hypothetical protein